MGNRFTIDGHTIELRTSSSGSISPWELDFAKTIDLAIWGTSDMRKFMLVDGDHIYAFDSFDVAGSVALEITENKFKSWDEFNAAINDLMEKNRIRDWGSLKDAIERLKVSKKRDTVWKSIPQNRKRETYEYLKKLSKEDQEIWYESKFNELDYSKNC